jgi:hypothetical protein
VPGGGAPQPGIAKPMTREKVKAKVSRLPITPPHNSLPMRVDDSAVSRQLAA